MARLDTIEALRRRGLSKKTAETLADAGFTLDSLKTTAPERLAKYIAAKEAKKILAKVGAPEGPSKKKEKKAAPEPAPEAEAAEAAEPTPKVPEKVPKSSEKEAEIFAMLEAIDRTLPRQIVWDLVGKIKGIKITKKQLQDVLAKVADRYERHLIDPNESAGIVSAQSIGEPGTQMSLPYEEKVVVREADRVRTVAIGAFVDALMDRHPVARDGPTEWCDLPRKASVEVPSLTASGRIVW
ncbi:MAG: hypothetical protein HY557_05230, partial [Euryarchaeota archaeon]|nr:hypothetical protein [Euryarchaeota archaeon]